MRCALSGGTAAACSRWPPNTRSTYKKSLSLMNLQIHHVISDITGASGLAILDAILAGDRDPLYLAHLC